MYRCSWVTNNNQCSQFTDKLTCGKCEIEKNKLYNRYKEAEKTVINAINSPSPRGDLLETSKVIGRISKVIELRKQFTSRLALTTRDPGHEYHISKLFQVINEYRSYVEMLVSEHETPCVEQEEETNAYTLIDAKCENIVNDIVETDPFREFDTTIQEYLRSRNTYLKFINAISSETGYDENTLKIILGVLSYLHLSKSKLPINIGQLIKYDIVSYPFGKPRRTHTNYSIFMEAIKCVKEFG